MKHKSIKKVLAQISTQKEENFSLLGIISPKPLFKIAFLLNHHLHFDFQLLNNDHLDYTLPDLPTIYFSHLQVDWYLFENVFQQKRKKFKDFDFFLIGYPKIEDEFIQKLVKQIHSLEEITIIVIIEQRKEIVEWFSSIL